MENLHVQSIFAILEYISFKIGNKLKKNLKQ